MPHTCLMRLAPRVILGTRGEAYKPDCWGVSPAPELLTRQKHHLSGQMGVRGAKVNLCGQKPVELRREHR
jgi:hypothetical protein